MVRTGREDGCEREGEGDPATLLRRPDDPGGLDLLLSLVCGAPIACWVVLGFVGVLKGSP